MKIVCELRSREPNKWKPIVTHEMDVPLFGANLCNPFPCSELFSFTAIDGSPIRVVYQVSEAVGA